VKNLKIGTRLAGGFGLVLALMVLMTCIGVNSMQSVADATRDMMQQPLAKERMIGDWYRLIHTSVRRTSAISKSNDPSLGAYFAEDTAASTKGVNVLQKDVEALLVTPEEKQAFEQIKQARKRYIASRDAIVALKKEGKLEEAEEVLNKTFTPDGDAYQGALRSLLELQRKSIDANAVRIEQSAEASRNFTVMLAVAVLGLSVFFSWRLTRGIVVPLNRAVEVAVAVAANDLRSDIVVDSTDETGRLLQALKTMNDGLERIVGEVRNGTEHMATASGEIAAGNQDLSSRTEQQAGSLEETSSAMEELTATVKQNADNARQANTLAVSASQVAVKGGAIVSQVVDTMGSINASSRKIVDIIAVIDGIAFQTNILALNAAVEAARAGEQGRGFAVVASEVRNLAQRSAAAAKEIKELIATSVQNVDEGSRLVNDAGQTMGDIVDSIQRVTDIMGEITSASAEQSAGIGHINEAMVQMDQVTQQNAALVEEAAAAAASLQDQAAALAGVVAVFKLHDTPAGRPARRAGASTQQLRLGTV